MISQTGYWSLDYILWVGSSLVIISAAAAVGQFISADAQGITITLFKIPHHPPQSTTSPSSKYHTTLFKVPHHLFKVPHHPLQRTTPHSSNHHTTLFKVPHHPLQSITPPSSKYHAILFKLPHHIHQTTTPPSSNYHAPIKLINNSHQIILFQNIPISKYFNFSVPISVKK